MTLYTSVIKRSRVLYIAGTIFVLAFGLTYEYFSHGVRSSYMMFAFIIPLVGGIASDRMLAAFRTSETSTKNPPLYHQMIGGGIIWLTLGSLFKGVLEIYGTTNKLSVVFVIVGIIQVAVGLTCYKIQSEATEC